jgi:putative transposase
MQLVERHVIGRDNPRYAVIDEAAFKAKNLYNAALYIVRQSFIFEGKYLNYKKMDKLMQRHEAYQALPRKVSQQVLKKLHDNWVSFFKQCEAYREDPSRFTGRPRLPRYKHKTEGRFLLVYTLQALSGGQSKTGIQGCIRPSGLPIEVRTKQKNINQVRIVPHNGHYVVEVVYEREPVQRLIF